MLRTSILLALLALTAPAQAHFVWVVVQPNEKGQPTANVYFSELAETDDAALLDKVAPIKVWSSDAQGTASAPLKLTKEEHKDGGGAWVAPLPSGSQATLAGTINYGVLERRGETFLLNYHARYLDGGAANLEKLARNGALPLEVVPYLAGPDSRVQVLWQGKPVAAGEVVVDDAAGKNHKLTTDEQGFASLNLSQPGLYSIRAKWVVSEAGKQDDKEYTKANHYSTLALRVSSPLPSTKADAPTSDAKADR